MQTQITQQIKDEVDRIFQDILKRFAAPKNTLGLEWISHNAADLKKIKVGWNKTNNGFRPNWIYPIFVPSPIFCQSLINPGGFPILVPAFKKGDTVSIRIDELRGQRGPGIGQGAGFEMTIFPVNLKAEMDSNPAVAKDPAGAVAATIAHEVGLHCIGATLSHFFDARFVDAKIATIRGVFSQPGGEAFLRGLGIALK